MYPKGNLLIPAPHGQLEAILKEPAGERRGVGLVCHPHPLGGGTMHNKVVFRAAAGLLDAGLATLRFNFRGVGASTGVPMLISRRTRGSSMPTSIPVRDPNEKPARLISSPGYSAAMWSMAVRMSSIPPGISE